MRKKIITLTESNLVSLIKKIISESKELGIGGFREIKSFKLVNFNDFLEYQSGQKKLDGEIIPQIRIRFYKKPVNGNYKVDFIVNDFKKNKFANDYIDFLDDEIEKLKLGESNIIETKDWIIEREIPYENFLNFKEAVLKHMEKNPTIYN